MPPSCRSLNGVSQGSTIDAEIYGAGIVLACHLIEHGERDFIGFAIAMARDLETTPQALRRYLRSWYEGARFACLDNGMDVSGCSSADEICDAIANMERWEDAALQLRLFPEPVDVPTGPAVPTEAELRALMGMALTAPTPDAVMNFAGFVSRMRRFAPFNVQMIYAQRPGAGLVASRGDWAIDGRTIRPGAIPILVLRPMGPIEHVFEQLDTDPPIPREPANDAFAAIGELAPARLEKLIANLRKPTIRNLMVRVHRTPFGTNLAGWIVGAAIPMSSDPPSVQKQTSPDRRGSTWNVSINEQLSETEQFVTLLHELGHLFCGHLGPFSDNNKDMDEFGWPDRRYLPHAAREIEAELVAWWLADREGLTTGSPIYLRPYMEQAGEAVSMVDVDRVTRAVARVRGYLGDRA
jgi:hypothetical protein